MRKALVEIATGKVVNVVELPDDWTGKEGEWSLPAGHELREPANAQPGDTWDGMQYVKAPPAKLTVISYEAFQDRFTAAEFNAATDFVYESDLTTGKPKRRALIQGLGRAMAKNTVDLNDARTVAFLDALVSGGVVTSARKTVILTP